MNETVPKFEKPQSKERAWEAKYYIMCKTLWSRYGQVLNYSTVLYCRNEKINKLLKYGIDNLPMFESLLCSLTILDLSLHLCFGQSKLLPVYKMSEAISSLCEAVHTVLFPWDTLSCTTYRTIIYNSRKSLGLNFFFNYIFLLFCPLHPIQFPLAHKMKI